MSKVMAVHHNCKWVTIVNLAYSRAKFGKVTGLIFVIGRNQKSIQELLYSLVLQLYMYSHTVDVLNLVHVYPGTGVYAGTKGRQ